MLCDHVRNRVELHMDEFRGDINAIYLMGTTNRQLTIYVTGFPYETCLYFSTLTYIFDDIQLFFAWSRSKLKTLRKLETKTNISQSLVNI